MVEPAVTLPDRSGAVTAAVWMSELIHNLNDISILFNCIIRKYQKISEDIRRYQKYSMICPYHIFFLKHSVCSAAGLRASPGAQGVRMNLSESGRVGRQKFDGG